LLFQNAKERFLIEHA